MSLPVIDLFAGISFFGHGTQQAGASVCLSVEIDPTYCETIAKNHRGSGEARILQGDVRALHGI